MTPEPPPSFPDEDTTIAIPFSQAAEEALIGAILLSPSALDEISLSPEDFYIARHAWVYEAALALQARRVTPDFITLSEELQRAGRLNEMGGQSYLAGLINRTPSSLGAKNYAETIKNYARRRRVLSVANDLAKAAHDATSDLLDATSRAVDDLTNGIRPNIGARHISDYLGSLYDEVEERAKDPKDVWGIPTGFIDFDRATGGLQLGEVYYLAGEPGVGKSKLAVQMGMNMGCAGFPGAIFSLEMSGHQLIRRSVSATAEIETRKLKTGRMEEKDWPVFTHAVEQMSAYPVYISEQTDLTTAALRAELAYLKSHYGIQWFLIDYLFLMDDGNGRMEDTERTALLSRRIKNIARGLNLGGITVNSVTKDGMGENAKASQKNLRGSGQVIHDADIIGFLLKHHPNQDEKYNPKLRTHVFAKGRELEGLGYFHLVAFDKWPSFGNYVPEKRIPF